LKNWILEVAFYKGQDSSDHDKIRRMDYSLTESSKQYIEFVSYCVCIFHLSFWKQIIYGIIFKTRLAELLKILNKNVL